MYPTRVWWLCWDGLGRNSLQVAGRNYRDWSRNSGRLRFWGLSREIGRVRWVDRLRRPGSRRRACRFHPFEVPPGGFPLSCSFRDGEEFAGLDLQDRKHAGGFRVQVHQPIFRQAEFDLGATAAQDVDAVRVFERYGYRLIGFETNDLSHGGGFPFGLLLFKASDSAFVVRDNLRQFHYGLAD